MPCGAHTKHRIPVTESGGRRIGGNNRIWLSRGRAMGLVDPSGTVVEDTRLAGATQLLKPGLSPLSPVSSISAP